MTEKLPENNFPAGYEVPKVWTWDKGNGGAFANINRPIAGPTHDKDLPVGKHPLQLYSLATPNGQKVTIMLEELLAAGHKDAEYDDNIIEYLMKYLGLESYEQLQDFLKHSHIPIFN